MFSIIVVFNVNLTNLPPILLTYKPTFLLQLRLKAMIFFQNVNLARQPEIKLTKKAEVKTIDRY